MRRKLVAALACRNQGTRLYGKPLQNLDIEKGVRIIDCIIDSLNAIDCIDQIVLGISEGEENEVFVSIAKEKGIEYIIGDEDDVLKRLIVCGKKVQATDIFRVTSESPFLYYQPIEKLWERHCNHNNDATFYDEIIDGCGFEIIALDALKQSHVKGEAKHRSELCTLYIRENLNCFKVEKIKADQKLNRADLRLTVDNPEDLVVCRAVYLEFKAQAPQINIDDVVLYLDQHPELKALTFPYTINGYNTMYL